MARPVKSACGQKSKESQPGPVLGPQNHRFCRPLDTQKAEKGFPRGLGKKIHFWTTKKLSTFSIWARFWDPQGSLRGLIFDPAHATHQLGAGAGALLRACQGLEAFFAPISVKICLFFFTFPIDVYRFSLYTICFPSRWFRTKIAITTKAPSQSAWS